MISIIIPFFNAQAWLVGAVESALRQRGVEVEIVCIDDGSVDGSLAVARGFEPALRVITGQRRGVAAARNRGIAETCGEWLVFLDADDLLTDGTLRQRLAEAATTGADVVICDWRERIAKRSGEVEGPIRAVEIPSSADGIEVACATRLWAPPAALMYRRALVEGIGGFRCDLPVIQDARFLFDAARQRARFVRSPHLGAYYRVRPDSVSRCDPAGFWSCVLLNGMQIEALWRAHGVLAAEQRVALADIYNSAAHGLFRARDPRFYRALAALRSAQLPITRRNQAAKLMANISGQPTAVRIAELWAMSRRALRRADRSN